MLGLCDQLGYSKSGNNKARRQQTQSEVVDFYRRVMGTQRDCVKKYEALLKVLQEQSLGSPGRVHSPMHQQ